MTAPPTLPADPQPANEVAEECIETFLQAEMSWGELGSIAIATARQRLASQSSPPPTTKA